jgi:ABC-2 type transport system ATP-binding protein
MLLIKAEHLYRSFGATVAVNDLSLAIGAGEIYGLVGPDGSGKTTTMRLLCGALRSGRAPGGEQPEIRIAGCDLSNQVEDARALIGYLPQRFSLYEDLTVLENIRFFAEARGLTAAEWRPLCIEILKFVGLDGFLDRRAGLLSGGMKQKLGLAAAMVHKPRVLFLDEPTTGVDPVTRQDFWQLILRLVSQQDSNPGDRDQSDEALRGTAVLVSTPYMDEASRCTRIGFMSNGKIIREGSPSAMRAELDGRVLELIGSPREMLRQLVKENPLVQDVQTFGDRLHLRVQLDAADQVIQWLQVHVPERGGTLELLCPIKPQLEDVFMSLSEVQE